MFTSGDEALGTRIRPARKLPDAGGRVGKGRASVCTRPQLARIQNKLLGQTLGHLAPDKGRRLLRPAVAPDPAGGILNPFCHAGQSGNPFDFAVAFCSVRLPGTPEGGEIHLSGFINRNESETTRLRRSLAVRIRKML